MIISLGVALVLIPWFCGKLLSNAQLGEAGPQQTSRLTRLFQRIVRPFLQGTLGRARRHRLYWASQSRLDDLRSNVELEVRQAWLSVQEAQARVKASAQAVTQADENLRSSRELYGADLATNTQVLDAVTLRIRAVSNRDNALLDESLARMRFEYAVGAL